MTNDAFYVTTSQSGGEGQGDTQTDAGTDIQMNLIGKTVKPMEQRPHNQSDWDLVG